MTESATSGQTEKLVTNDGKSLKRAIQKANVAARNRAMVLVLPLLLFLIFAFITPILNMISDSVSNTEIPGYMPNTVEAIADWDGEDLPDEPVYAAMVEDMIVGGENRTIGRAAGIVNRSVPGARGAIMRSSRDADELEPPFKEKLIEANDTWGDPIFWKFIKNQSSPITMNYFLMAVDREYTPEGEIVQTQYPVYINIFIRTLGLSALITALTILLAYPIAYKMASLPARKANLLMILVLLPFWTSLLVRTSAWMVLLGNEGVINEFLVWANLVDPDDRPQLIYNATGTIIAMTHILLPFMVLPLYSVMKTIKPSYLRAATSMGAHPFTAWWKVYFPLSLPGMAAGVILVFILAIGYYITPALVGGEDGIFISNLIADNMQGTSANRKLALALSTILLVGVLIIYWIFNKLVGVDRLKFG